MTGGYPIRRRSVLKGTGTALGAALLGLTLPERAAAQFGGEGVVFTQDGDLRSVVSDGGSVSTLPGESVSALGPATTDIDTDGRIELPFLTDGEDIALLDDADTDPQPVAVTPDAQVQKTLLSVGQWGGAEPSVFYVDADGSDIYRTSRDGTTELIASPDNGADAIAGIADLDGDGEDELVFADGSQAVRYVEPDDETTATFSKAYDGAGANNNVGIGAPADFSGDGVSSVPIVDGSNQIHLVGDDGIRRTLIGGSDDEQAAKTPLTPADIDADGDLELVYLENNSSPAELNYVDEVDGDTVFRPIRDDDGDRIRADTQRGVVRRRSGLTGVIK